MIKTFLTGLLLFSAAAHAGHEVDTNEVHMADAPSWVSRNRIDRLVAHVQNVMDGTVKKINVFWYSDEGAFEKMHGLGPSMMAISRKTDDTIHLGPRITNANFDQIFSHELVHIIAHQKYKQSIPAWLEEGLANYLSKSDRVDYHWLKTQPIPDDVRSFTHPTKGSVETIHYHYMTSEAVTEMIAHKCDLTQLLQDSMGEDMETRIANQCETPDLNASYKKWLKSKG